MAHVHMFLVDSAHLYVYIQKTSTHYSSSSALTCHLLSTIKPNMNQKVKPEKKP